MFIKCMNFGVRVTEGTHLGVLISSLGT